MGGAAHPQKLLEETLELMLWPCLFLKDGFCGTPSRSSQASTDKVTVKELEAKLRGGRDFVPAHAGLSHRSQSEVKGYRHEWK